jgi:thiol:disulfide interchange protein
MRWMRWAMVAAAAMAVALLAPGCSREKASPAKASAASQERIAWAASYDQAVAKAKEEGKPLMVDVMASWCGVCKKLDTQIWTREDVAKVSEGFVAAKVDGDKYPDLKQKLVVSGYPTTLFLTADGKELGRVRGLVAPEDMVGAMQDALAEAKERLTTGGSP